MSHACVQRKAHQAGRQVATQPSTHLIGLCIQLVTVGRNEGRNIGGHLKLEGRGRNGDPETEK